MGWARFDDMRALNRKLRKAGFAARGLDEAAICQVAADQSDGHISLSTVKMLASAHNERHVARLVARLVSVGRWVPNGDGWFIHDYLEYNPSKADLAVYLQKRRDAGKQGGLASAVARASANGQANGQPDPTRPRVYARAREGKPVDPVENTALAQAKIIERNEERRRHRDA